MSLSKPIIKNQELEELIFQKDLLEKRISKYGHILAMNNNVGMYGSLVDSENVLRRDIDLHQVCQARQEIKCLQIDYKKVMNRIEKLINQKHCEVVLEAQNAASSNEIENNINTADVFISKAGYDVAGDEVNDISSKLEKSDIRYGFRSTSKDGYDIARDEVNHIRSKGEEIDLSGPAASPSKATRSVAEDELNEIYLKIAEMELKNPIASTSKASTISDKVNQICSKLGEVDLDLSVPAATVSKAGHEVKENWLNTDLAEQMDELSFKLAEIELGVSDTETDASSNCSEKTMENICHIFALIGKVKPGSPAEEAGLQENDGILEFGNVNSQNFENLLQLRKVALDALNQEVFATVERGEEVLEIMIKPKSWNGCGYIGCDVILPE